MCAIHALNNLFQRVEFDEEFFDSVASTVHFHSVELDIPIEDPIGGNYNFTTIEAALTSHNYQMERLQVNELDEASLNNSLPTGSYLVGTNRHWFSLRRFKDDGHLWYFDSLRKGPEKVLELKSLLGENGPETFVWHSVFRIVFKTPSNTTTRNSQTPKIALPIDGISQSSFQVCFVSK